MASKLFCTVSKPFAESVGLLSALNYLHYGRLLMIDEAGKADSLNQYGGPWTVSNQQT